MDAAASKDGMKNATAVTEWERYTALYDNHREAAFKTQTRHQDLHSEDKTLRRCRGCGSFHKWKRMKSVAVEDVSDPRLTWWVFTCLSCHCARSSPWIFLRRGGDLMVSRHTCEISPASVSCLACAELQSSMSG